NGGGFNVGWITPGEWLEYSVNVQQTRSYTVSIRYAVPAGSGTMHIEFNGSDVSGPINMPDTGSWTTFDTFVIPNVPLTAGPGVIRLSFDNGNQDGWLANINYVDFQ